MIKIVELETNTFSDDSDDSDEERDNIQFEQEEEIEWSHASRHRKILTSSRLVHSIDSVLDRDNLSKLGRMLGNICRLSRTKI